MTRTNAAAWRRAGAVAVIGAGAAIVLAAGGTLDPGFGAGGMVTVATRQGGIRDVVVQPDGRILTGGWDRTDRLTENGLTIDEGQVRRFAANGSIDTTFGTAGLVRLFGEYGGLVQDLAVDGSGRVVAGGYSKLRLVTVTGSGKKKTTTITFPEFAAVARLGADGSVDATFGTGGVARPSIPGAVHSNVGEVMIQADGRVVVAGSAYFPGATSHPTDQLVRPYVARLLANGAADTSFGSGGVAVDLADTGGLQGAALQSTGHVVLKVTRGSQLRTIARVTPAGAFDGGFAAIGVPDNGTGVSVDRFDRIVVTGVSAGLIRVARYLPTGSADTSFGTGGVLLIGGYTSQQARSDALFQADDKIVFGAYFAPVGRPVVGTTIRLTDAGALDTTYGSGGWGSLIHLSYMTPAQTAALAPDGGILLSGITPGSVLYLARFAGN